MSDLHGLSAEDVLAIQAIVVKYGFLIDDREFDRLGEVFTDDVYVDYRDHRYDPPTGEGPFVGLEEIQRQMYILQHPIQHMLVSLVIDEASGDEVVVRSKALFPLPTGGLPDHAYRDVLVRTPKGWRIKHKTTYSYRPLPSKPD